MAKPPDVSTAQVITASHINAIKDSVFTWQDPIDGNGKSLTNVGIIASTPTSTGTGVVGAITVTATASPSSAPGNSFYAAVRADSTYSSSQSLTASWGVGGLYGGFIRAIRSTGAGDVTSAYAVLVNVQNLASGTITNAHGLYVANPYVPAGSITSNYGLYIDSQTAGSSNNWAIYSAGGHSYHAGRFLVGSNTDDNINALQVSGSAKIGGLTAGYRTESTNYSIAAGDYTINCTATMDATLPTASGITGRVYVIKNSGSGTVTIKTTSSQTIDGSTTKNLAQYEFARVQSDGSNWIVI